jgi:hypothetical protein
VAFVDPALAFALCLRRNPGCVFVYYGSIDVDSYYIACIHYPSNRFCVSCVLEIFMIVKIYL